MTALKRGDEFVTYPERRPCERHFIQVTRVAKDGTWADIRVRTWAVSWSKRQPLTDGALPGEAVPHTLTQTDLIEQETDHMEKQRVVTLMANLEAAVDSAKAARSEAVVQ